jgi:hypothetical protein
MSREHRQPSGTPPSFEPNISASMDSHELVLSRRVRNACTIATTIQVRHGRVYVGLATCVLGMSFRIITVPGFPPPGWRVVLLQAIGNGDPLRGGYRHARGWCVLAGVSVRGEVAAPIGP